MVDSKASNVQMEYQFFGMAKICHTKICLMIFCGVV
jgi:hypothetical protein